MKYVYGKDRWKTLAEGNKDCFLLTNGLGGFSSLSLTGANARGDHALFMGARIAPNDRVHMVTNVHETLHVGGEAFSLATQSFVSHAKNLCGYKYLSHFSYEYVPTWYYQVQGVSVAKTVVTVHGKNTVGVFYEVRKPEDVSVSLWVTPLLRMTAKDERADRSTKLEWMGDGGIRRCAPVTSDASARVDVSVGADMLATLGAPLMSDALPASDDLTLYFQTDGTIHRRPQSVTDELYFPLDARDGRDACGICFTNHDIEFTMEGEVGRFYIVYSMDAPHLWPEQPWSWMENEIRRQKKLELDCSLKSDIARMLAKNADAYVVDRDSTKEKSIIAGYPFFGDWGRDTMIALPGLTLTTKRFGDAKSILRSFARYCHKGLMPNLFPEGGSQPMYNTVDAALLFINCVYLYYQKTKDRAFVREVWPVMTDVIRWYIQGSDYNIHMDSDGLIVAGEGLWQVTWMDVRYGDILPTPRHGKPVEINAYWYNALKIMETLAPLAGAVEPLAGAVEPLAGALEPLRGGVVMSAGGAEPLGGEMEWPGDGVVMPDGGPEPLGGAVKLPNSPAAAGGVAGGVIDYKVLAAMVCESFNAQFWNEKDKCLKDVISAVQENGAAAYSDTQIRCNQIWALSLPFTMVDAKRARQILNTVSRHLFTPWGLRSLPSEDGQFCPSYGGSQFQRDMAYHQGTVWAFPLGAYYRARIRFADDRQAEAKWVLTQLEAIGAAMGEGCLGHIAEIYDGLLPNESRGCFAQAWSVGEILGAYAYAEEMSGVI